MYFILFPEHAGAGIIYIYTYNPPSSEILQVNARVGLLIFVLF